MGRLALRATAFATLAGSVARYGSDSTRYGAEASIDHRGLGLRGELIGQHRPDLARDDQGWFALATYRLLPWLQLVGKQEDFQRPARGLARRMSATTAGANVDLPGGRTRFLANFISRTTGFPRVWRRFVILQAQVRF